MKNKVNHRQLSVMAFLAATVVLSWPLYAWAHVGSGEAGGFLIGLQHPVSGLDHVLAMIAVGLWGAQLGAPALWILPVVFPMMMAMGGMLGLMGIPIPGVEVGIAVSAIVLGFMILALQSVLAGRLRWTERVFGFDVLIGSFKGHQPRAAWMGLGMFGGLGVVMILAGSGLTW